MILFIILVSLVLWKFGFLPGTATWKVRKIKNKWKDTENNTIDEDDCDDWKELFKKNLTDYFDYKACKKLLKTKKKTNKFIAKFIMDVDDVHTSNLEYNSKCVV